MNIKPLILLLFLACLISCHSATKNSKSEKQTKSDTPYVTIDKPIGYKPSKEDSATINSNFKDNKKANVKLIFPDFNINFPNFWVSGTEDNIGKFRYDGNASEAELNVDDSTLKVKANTLHLSYNPAGNLDTCIIEIIPKYKAERFRVSYSFKIAISKFGEPIPPLWEKMSCYKRVKDSLNYFFNIPIFANSNTDIAKIKKSLNLRDTTHKYYDGDYGEQTETDVIYHKKLCVISDSGELYLKIEKLNGNSLKDTKFILIAFDDGE